MSPGPCRSPAKPTSPGPAYSVITTDQPDSLRSNPAASLPHTGFLQCRPGSDHLPMIPTISDYYRAAIEALRNEVEATTDADVIGRDHDDWYADLIEKHGMVPIEIDASRGEKLVEVEREHVLRGYDVCTDQIPGSVVKTNDVRIEVPVRGGPLNSDSLLRWDPDPGEGVWHATEETELSC